MKSKILVASDKYKGSLSAIEVCSIIKNAIKEIDGEIDVIVSPMADGGEGTVETLVESQKGKYIVSDVTGPLGEKVKARIGIIGGNTAIIEMASASGLALIPKEKRNPMETTTYGTGELIKKALNIGCRKVIIGIGGSATTDGGMGMAQALDVKFYNSCSNLLGFGGRQLLKLKRIDMSNIHPAVSNIEFNVASDVDNPLTGKNGAAYVYSPQKGADRGMVKKLDLGLVNFSKIIKKDLGKDISNLKGAGAAGGLGAGLHAFLNATLRSGTDIIIEANDLESKIKEVDLVITGEGAMDKQTFFGKSSYGVAMLARKYNIPVITINGSVFMSRDEINRKNADLFCGNFSIIKKPMKLEDAVKNSRNLLESATQEIITFYKCIKRC